MQDLYVNSFHVQQPGESTSLEAACQETGSIGLKSTIRCCAGGRSGIWVSTQEGSVHLYGDKDGSELLRVDPAEILKLLSAGKKLPRRPYWCAMHESEGGCLWLGMASAGTSGTGILVGLQIEKSGTDYFIKDTYFLTDQQKGAVRAITSKGDLLLTSSDDNNVVVRASSDGKCKALLKGHSAWVNSIIIAERLEPTRDKFEAEEEQRDEKMKSSREKSIIFWTGAGDGLRTWKWQQARTPEVGRV
eukprot:1264862-Amorphochlora_amoeboformis.AAC.1